MPPCRSVNFARLRGNKDRRYLAWESFVISRQAISFPYCRVNDALGGCARAAAKGEFKGGARERERDKKTRDERERVRKRERSDWSR